MFNDPRTRLRKLVSGVYTMVRKTVAGTKTYSATIEKVDARDFQITITDEANEVVSISSSVSLKEAVKLLRGQLTDLDVKLPVFQPAEEPIEPPIPPEGFIDSLVLDSNTITAGIAIEGYALVVDIDDNPLPGKTVDWSVSAAPTGTTLTVINAVTDSEGKSYIEFSSTLATALTAPPKVTAEVDSSSVQSANIFVQPDFEQMVFSNVGAVTLVGGETDVYEFSSDTRASAIQLNDQYGNGPLDGVTGNPAVNIMSIQASDAGAYIGFNPPGTTLGPLTTETDLPGNVYLSGVNPNDWLRRIVSGRNSGSGSATLTLRPTTNADPEANKVELIIPFA